MSEALAGAARSRGREDVRVLLVDDQPIIGETIRRIVADQPDIVLEVCTAPTEAIAAALRFHPTIILLDLVMPVIDGLTLLRFFRAHEATRDVPIIVLSAKEDPVVKSDAFESGASDYIVKLPDEREVLARVRHHSEGYSFLLQRNQAQRELAASHDVLSNLHEELQRRNSFIQKTFGRYLSDDVVDELLADPAGLEFGGEKRLVTIMMTDLRGFTSLSERLLPEHVVRILNVFLGRMVDIVMDHGGTIDEFLGDAILAIFGAPITRDDDARRAVECALRMQCAIPDVNAALDREGLPPVEMGIALNTGRVVVGNIGSQRRAKYGVVGSHVNLTARIESNTVGGQILVSDATLAEAGRLRFLVGEELMVRAKGFSEPVLVHEIIGTTGPDALTLPTEHDALHPLAQPVPVTVTVVSGGHLNTEANAGVVHRLGRRTAAIRMQAGLPHLTDVRLRFAAGALTKDTTDAYAKVGRDFDTSTSSLVVRFTSVPPEVRAALDALIDS